MNGDKHTGRLSYPRRGIKCRGQKSERKRDLNWSESEMRATSEKYRLNSYDGEELPFENYMKLDNTNPAPDEVAKMIKALFSIEE